MLFLEVLLALFDFLKVLILALFEQFLAPLGLAVLDEDPDDEGCVQEHQGAEETQGHLLHCQLGILAIREVRKLCQAYRGEKQEGLATDLHHLLRR